MPRIIEQTVARLRRSLRPQEARMPLDRWEGTSGGHDPRPFPWLTDEQIDRRLEVGNRHLRARGMVLSADDLPMSELSDDDLDERIAHAEAMLFEDLCDAELEAELRILDHLIADPTATVEPLWSMRPRPDMWNESTMFGAWDLEP